MMEAAQTDHKYISISLSTPTLLYLPALHHSFSCTFEYISSWGGKVWQIVDKVSVFRYLILQKNILYIEVAHRTAFSVPYSCFSLQSPMFALHYTFPFLLSVHPLISFFYPAAFNLHPLLSRLPGVLALAD